MHGNTLETLQGQGPGRGPGSRSLRTRVRGKALRGVASLTQEGCFPSVWRDSRRHEVSKGKLGIGASEKQLSPEEAPGCHRIPGDSSWGLRGFPFELLHLGSCFRGGGGGLTLWPCFGGCGACRRWDLAGGGRKEGSLQLSLP